MIVRYVEQVAKARNRPQLEDCGFVSRFGRNAKVRTLRINNSLERSTSDLFLFDVCSDTYRLIESWKKGGIRIQLIDTVQQR
jgi:hypothetical protein